MADTATTQAGLSHEFVDETGRSWGFFNADEVDFGSEVTHRKDPELGDVLTGSAQTGDSMGLSRVFAQGRDSTAYKVLKPLRGRLNGKVNIHELDAYGQPLSSTPLDVLTVRLTNVKKPPGNVEGDDQDFEITVEVRAT